VAATLAAFARAPVAVRPEGRHGGHQSVQEAHQQAHTVEAVHRHVDISGFALVAAAAPKGNDSPIGGVQDADERTDTRVDGRIVDLVAAQDAEAAGRVVAGRHAFRSYFRAGLFQFGALQLAHRAGGSFASASHSWPHRSHRQLHASTFFRLIVMGQR
jgi:hypothetical protein